MNKVLKVILNILIVVFSLAFLVSLINLFSSIEYANREVEDPAKTYAGVFDYEIEHRAYGEILGSYYSRRMGSFTPEPGYENLYSVGEYAHAAFMTRVYDEKGDRERSSADMEKIKTLRKEMGDYEYTADEIDKMLQAADAD